MEYNPNDPNRLPPMEESPPNIQYQPVYPTYQGQPGEPYYQGQPAAPYTPPADQVAAAPQGAESISQQKAENRKYGIAKLMDYIQWVLISLELLLLVEFSLKLLGADPSNPFAAFIYVIADFFLYPFQGIVPSTKLGPQGNAIIAWSTLIAMAVYALIFYLVKLLLHTTISRPQEPIE